MFQNWSNYYVLLGTASGSLIGLLFIVATLFSGRDRTRMLRAAAVYTTPTVFNLAMVLMLCAMTLAPGVRARFAGDALLTAALAGVIHGVVVIGRFRVLNAGEAPHWSDFWCYCLGPAAVYVALGLCGLACWRDASAAPPVLACILMAMLLLAIRNAWDLVTWMAPARTPDKDAPTGAAPIDDV
jgi:hypothetical protein